MTEVRSSWHSFSLWWDVRDEDGQLIESFRYRGDALAKAKELDDGLDLGPRVV
jgi:hypothetical protein